MRQTRLFILAAVMLFAGHDSVAQEQKKKKKSDDTYWICNFGVSSFNYTSVEAGYGFITELLYKKGKYSTIGNRHLIITGDLSAEMQFGTKVLFGPKLSNKYSFEIWDWEFNYLGFIAGADYIAWNDFQTFNHVLQPSLGVHYFFDVLELSYGYNIRLDKNPSLPLNTHVIRLRLKPGIIKKLLEEGWGQG